MSTRSILIFKDSYEYVGVYRHSDGYTEGVINDLEQFFKWSCRNDSSYVAANYIYWTKNQTAKWLRKEKIKNHPNNDYTQIGHGLINDVKNYYQGDVEYIHVIELRDNNMVTSYKVVNSFSDDNNYILEHDQTTLIDNKGKILRTDKGNTGIKISYSSLFEGA